MDVVRFDNELRVCILTLVSVVLKGQFKRFNIMIGGYP